MNSAAATVLNILDRAKGWRESPPHRLARRQVGCLILVDRCMHLIPTIRKEKLPKGFSYPLGAEAMSAAFDGVPQLASASLWFMWRDEYWASRWRQKLESHGEFMLLEVNHSPLSGERVLYVYSVPSDYSVVARERLSAEVPVVRQKLLAGSRARIVVTLSLSGAKGVVK